MDTELKKYIDKSTSEGYSPDQIREQLVAAGWPDDSIAQAFAAASPAKPEVTVPVDNPNSSPITDRSPSALVISTKYLFLLPVFALFTGIMQLLLALFLIIVGAVSFQNNPYTAGLFTYAPHLALVIFGFALLFSSFTSFLIYRHLKFKHLVGYRSLMLFALFITTSAIILTITQVFQNNWLGIAIFLFVGLIAGSLVQYARHLKIHFPEPSSSRIYRLTAISIAMLVATAILLLIAAKLHAVRMAIFNITQMSEGPLTGDSSSITWKTYSHPELKFKLEYPQDWQFKTYTTPDQRQIVAFSSQNLPEDYVLLTPETAYITIRVEDIATLPEQSYKIYQQRISQSGDADSPYPATTLGGQKGYRINGTHIAEYNNHLYQLVLRTQSDNQTLTEISQHILDSFAFE